MEHIIIEYGLSVKSLHTTISHWESTDKVSQAKLLLTAKNTSPYPSKQVFSKYIIVVWEYFIRINS